MKTVGIDLSADIDETAACCIDWNTASVRFLRRPITDDELVTAALEADVTAIDIPLGWPDPFVEALVAHREGREWPVADVAPPADRLKLKFRTTDEVVRALGAQPLSVAADRIGVAAMRGARLQHLLGQSGCMVDRTGLTGRVIETYPAAVLRAWKMQSSGYKGPKKIDIARALGAELAERCGSMRSPIMDGLSACDDDDLDALICAVVARAARLGLTTPPPRDLREIASREGWIHIPTVPVEDIIGRAP